MKNIRYSIFIGIFTIVSLNAQEIGSSLKQQKEENTLVPKHILKVFPLAALGGDIGIGYERVIRPKRTLNFLLFQGFDNPNFSNSVSGKSYNLSSEVGLRFYLSKQKKAPEGWFVSTGLLAEYTYDKLRNKVSNKITDFERIQVAGNSKMGYQWIFEKGLKGVTTEVSGGLGYRINTGILDGRSLSGLDIYLNFAVGYSW